MSNGCACEGDNVMLFPCSGASDVGELSDRIARQLSRDKKGRMFCLAGIGAHIPGMIAGAQSAQAILAIDGCPTACSKKLLEHAGLHPTHYELSKIGFKRGSVCLDEESVTDAVRRIGL